MKKLNKGQLRQLVRGVLREQRVTAGVQDAMYGEMLQFCESFTAHVQDEYDPRDPVQSEYGLSAWNEQCEEAALELENKIAMALDTVWENLHNGDYAGEKF